MISTQGGGYDNLEVKLIRNRDLRCLDNRRFDLKSDTMSTALPNQLVEEQK